MTIIVIEPDKAAELVLFSAVHAPPFHAASTAADIGSGKISSWPSSMPSRMALATPAGSAFGTATSRIMSVSIGPASTAWTRTPVVAIRARRDCVIENAAAFDNE
ncbi:MAG TPA: hypothetical protein VFU98_09505 [Microlunatus sp.]|nr:hypothetical protein [Microlunatus sp.]